MPGWREADFVRLMGEGERPDDSDVHPPMPWDAFNRTSDAVLITLFRYFRSVYQAGNCWGTYSASSRCRCQNSMLAAPK